jgi:hypothetical protein
MVNVTRLNPHLMAVVKNKDGSLTYHPVKKESSTSKLYKAQVDAIEQARYLQKKGDYRDKKDREEAQKYNEKSK